MDETTKNGILSLIGLICLIILMKYGCNDPKDVVIHDKREIKPCSCVSYKEYTYRQAKYEYFLMRRDTAKPKDKSRWQDSVTRQLNLLLF